MKTAAYSTGRLLAAKAVREVVNDPNQIVRVVVRHVPVRSSEL